MQSTSSEVNELITNTATFTDCTFINNTSPAGAGVYLVSNLRVDQLLAATEFTNWQVNLIFILYMFIITVTVNAVCFMETKLRGKVQY